MNIKKAFLVFAALLAYAIGLSCLYLFGLPGFAAHCAGAAFLAAGILASLLSLKALKEGELASETAAFSEKQTPGAFLPESTPHEMENVCLGLFERESAVEVARTSVDFLNGYFALEGAAVICSDEDSFSSVLAARGIPEDILLTYWKELDGQLPEKTPSVRALAYRPYLKSASDGSSGKLAAAVFPLVCRNVLGGYLLLLRCGDTGKFSTLDLSAAGRFSRYLAAALSLAHTRAAQVLPESFQMETEAA